MNEINNGGAAYPGFNYVLSNVHDGMTLRDWFAAKAMQGALTGPVPSSSEEKDYVAMHAYRMADAMLRARGGA